MSKHFFLIYFKCIVINAYNRIYRQLSYCMIIFQTIFLYNLYKQYFYIILEGFATCLVENRE